MFQSLVQVLMILKEVKIVMRFLKIIDNLKLNQPKNATATNAKDALKQAKRIGYPLVVRPSYVLGGRAMQIVFSDQELADYLIEAVSVSHNSPVLLDQFLDNAIEVDVDVLCDCKGNILIAGIMQHIEQAGIHSGDSACVLPPHTL